MPKQPKQNPKQKWENTPNSKELRLNKVDKRATVDVGLSKKFKNKLGPGWRSELWQGKSWMEVSGYDVTVNREGELKSHAIHGDVYECECLRQARGRKRAERHLIIPGSTEYQIIWDTINDIPETNYIDLELNFSGDLTWYKQLPLTQEEIEEGHIRSDDVINSYAVYAPYSGRFIHPDGTEVVNYETGKFCHIYRPKLIDANGNELWCDQTAPFSGPNRLRVYLDLDWLSGATFPVVLDPTFGYTSLGASSASAAFDFYRANVASANCYTASSGDIVTKMSIGARTTSGSASFDAGIYAISGTTPGARLGSIGAFSISISGSLAWYDSSIVSWAMVASTTYCSSIAVKTLTPTNYHAYDSAAANSDNFIGGTFPLPSSWGSGTLYAYKSSVYATYSVASTIVIPVFMNQYRQRWR